MTIFDQYL